jgi:hypothetical protein
VTEHIVGILSLLRRYLSFDFFSANLHLVFDMFALFFIAVLLARTATSIFPLNDYSDDSDLFSFITVNMSSSLKHILVSPLTSKTET